jgi:hypothetical protein
MATRHSAKRQSAARSGAALKAARTTVRALPTQHTMQQPGKPAPGNTTVRRALAELAAAGKLTGQHSEKISARVDPGVMEAAAAQLGLSRDDVSAVVNAALAVAAAPDRFKTWLRTTDDTLPDGFELAI